MSLLAVIGSGVASLSALLSGLVSGPEEGISVSRDLRGVMKAASCRSRGGCEKMDEPVGVRMSENDF